MKNTNFFENYFKNISESLDKISINDLNAITDLILKVKKNNKKIIIAGNGGSSSIASHVSVDLTKVAKIRSITFNESNLITCFANDYGYENWVKAAIKFYADQGDLVILISSSGKSPNIINAAKECKNLGLNLITFSGFDQNNQLSSCGNYNLWVNSREYNVIEMTHHIWLLSLVDYIIANQ